jgi:hypothetical protein
MARNLPEPSRVIAAAYSVIPCISKVLFRFRNRIAIDERRPALDDSVR